MQQQLVNEVMTPNPTTLEANASVRAAAEEMRTTGIGAVIVEEAGEVCGIVTDRDIVVRCVATGGDTDETTVGSICSRQLAKLSPDDTVDNAVNLMRKKGIRRIPVMEDGRALGILSLGDLAVEREPGSVLGKISAQEANL